MGIYGYIWVYMGIYGYIWVYMGMAQNAQDMLDTKKTIVLVRYIVGVKEEDIVGVKEEDIVGVEEEDIVGVKEEDIVGVKEEDIVGVKEEEGLQYFIKRRKLAMFGHKNRRPDSVVLTSIEGELPGKKRKGRRKMG